MKLLLLSLALLLSSCAASGQTTPATQKVALDHADFDQWRSISNEQFTRDGTWLVYALNPQEGDGELVVRSVDSGQETRLERGERFRVNEDGTHLIYLIATPYADERQARIDGKRLRDVFEDTLAIHHLASGETETFAQVTSFKLPDKSGEWLAYRYERKKADNNRTRGEDPEEESAEGEGSGERGESGSESEHEADQQESPDTSTQTENDLVVRHLPSGEETVIPWVESYYFSRHGERLIYRTVDKDTLSSAALYSLELASGHTRTISDNLQDYRSVAMDSTGTLVAFLARPASPEEEQEQDADQEQDHDADAGNGSHAEDEEDAPEYYGLYLYIEADGASRLIADETSPWLAERWMINEHARPYFSHDSTRLLFGTAPEPMRRDRSVEKIDMASVDVWHWRDDRLQSQQLVQRRQDQRRTFDAVYHIADDRFVQLADHDMENVTIPDRNNARYALGSQNRHYLYRSQWEGFPVLSDLFRVDVHTGERELLATAAKVSSTLSPQGRYMAWYDYTDQNWHAMDMQTMAVTNLTGHLDVLFYNELHDSPSDPGPYGVEGWTENDTRVVIRDRYDLWVIDPRQPQQAFMLTGGLGREQRVTLRHEQTDPDARYIPQRGLYLRGFHEEDKASSLHRTDLDAGTPQLLWKDDVRLVRMGRAADADRWMVRKSTFREFPDIWLTDADFSGFNRISHANPQQEHYLWGDVELFEYTSLDGQRLDALLYTPENFDPGKQYPMIVYFYERTSQNLHAYRAPAPSASTITPAFYTSRGYIVAMPDIAYKVGNPGRSAEDAVIGMTLHLLDRGFVDRDRIGLQGQSWGGYQIAHIITRTDMFAAAMAGAPVSNMISAYGGIRWASGLNRQFQYEQTQSRIGGSLWERPIYYIENSPIFFADRVQTPLLMMHNDDDGAVPWYQGIEFFTALRRLEQPVWMLNYNDEAHNLRERVNRKDLSRRMQQFFDHYLMDAPMPVWMKYGVPAVEKGLHQGFGYERPGH